MLGSLRSNWHKSGRAKYLPGRGSSLVPNSATTISSLQGEIASVYTQLLEEGEVEQSSDIPSVSPGFQWPL